ncbi:hypothetical protein [Clavibacter sp.]|uniref:hypothetical protein n=1 Tax=Clavibacter sp. TaxID=1871044 RepID=UPI0019BE05D9|nr:hypothetical protein [Clavibacter sp.]MBD5381907.1 hypothetical protein [Clavibacter sp.]
MTELELFREAFYELPNCEQLSLYFMYQRDIVEDGEEWHDFDEDFFEVYFSNPMEAVRAWHFGGDNSWNDDYIKFNAYGNLETACEYEVLDEARQELDNIFEHPEIWKPYIGELDDDESDDDEDENY